MNKSITEHSMKATRFLAKSEDKIITRFMEIAGLEDEYQQSVDPNAQTEITDYAQAMLVQEFSNRGYEISVRHDKLAPMDGVDKGMKWRLVLLHDGNEVAYADNEIKIDTMQMDGNGGQS